MAMPGQVSEVEKLSGVDQQLTPEELQIVDGEPQTITQAPMPLIEIAEPEKRVAPLPVTYTPPIAAPGVAGAPAPVFYIGQPILVVNRYSGNSQNWQELLHWDIPVGLVGDLHEISLLSTNDAVTRWQVIIGNIDMQVPLDRATSTPYSAPWRDTKIPGGTSVVVRVRSETGAAIIIDGAITGTLRTP